MFKNTYDNIFNLLFGIPQVAVMTLSVLIYRYSLTPAAFLTAYAKGYVVSLALTSVFSLGAFGAGVTSLLRIPDAASFKKAAGIAASGVFMAFAMSAFMTFFELGPKPEYFLAFGETFVISIIPSCVSVLIFIPIFNKLVERIVSKSKKRVSEQS